MKNLPPTDKLRLATSSTADIHVTVSGVDLDNTTPTAQVFVPFAEPPLTITAIGTVDITTVAAANHFKNVKEMCFYNDHATDPNTLILIIDRSGTGREQKKVTLLAGEAWVYAEGVWFHYNANGGVYGDALPVASDTVVGGIEIASQAEQEAGTDVTRAVTPGRQHFHPSAAKFWVIWTGNSTTITASYNMTSITDGTTEATVTIANDFSGTAWCVQATGIGTASTVAAARLASARAMAAGSIIIWFVDAAATSALADPTSGCVVGYGDL